MKQPNPPISDLSRFLRGVCGGLRRALGCALVLLGSTIAASVAEQPGDQGLTCYLISDLHIGGDGGLDRCAFEPELIAFLRQIADGPLPAELMIVGDAFGLWELTEVKVDEKLQWIAQRHPELFAQFRETGRKVRITLLPGNHDYELACEPRFKDQLAQYNIGLEPRISITREIAGRKVWIEHGNQHDEFNAFPHFGDPYGLPAGYFITTHTVAAAAQSAEKGRSPWLDDLQSVYPSEDIPFWMGSNYFYKEMSPLLRWLLLPFLLLFGVSVVVFAGRALENFGVLRTKLFHASLGARLGLPGRLLDWVLWVNGVVISFLLVLAIPMYLVARDVRGALHRYGVDRSEESNLEKDARYVAAAKAVFEEDPAVALYVYGHTHAASMRKIGPRYVINTGTWLKRMERVRAHCRLLPDVYAPSYRLNYFTVSGRGNDLCVGYQVIAKEPPDDLTWLEQLMILGRSRDDAVAIPAETILPAEESSS